MWSMSSQKNPVNLYRNFSGLPLVEDITYADSMGNCFFALPDNSYFYQDESQLLLFGEGYRLRDGIMEQICSTNGCLDLAQL